MHQHADAPLTGRLIKSGASDQIGRLIKSGVSDQIGRLIKTSNLGRLIKSGGHIGAWGYTLYSTNNGSAQRRYGSDFFLFTTKSGVK